MKFPEWLKNTGKFIVSFVTTNEWLPDPYKIMGFICLFTAIKMGWKVFELATQPKPLDASTLGVLAGLASIIGGFASGLFVRAALNDSLPYEEETPNDKQLTKNGHHIILRRGKRR